MKQIEGYENYSVTEDGKVWSKYKNGFMKPFICGVYIAVTLRGCSNIKNKYIHRLVAEAFIENSESKPQVNHKDKNTHNNNVDNLEWVTALENNRHSWINRESHLKGRKLSIEQRKKMSIAHKGKIRGPHSEEAKRKISESQKARHKKNPLQN
jgi:hypothetical protein